jgi:DNA repair exonuclease SbcCD ATPase subunit
MATRSIQETIADWEVMHSNLGSQIDAMPHLDADHEALQALIAGFKALENEQESLKAALRETNQKRAEMLQSGRELTGRIAASLRGRFGLHSEQLVRYGIKPRPREIRRRVLSKAEKAAHFAELAARAAAEAEAASRLKQALQPANGDVSPKLSQAA